jgi:hypothetical protein
MRGMSKLVDLRRIGTTPDVVFIETDDALAWRGPETWHERESAPAQLQAPKPDLSVLRCIVGLTVCVQGSDLSRVHAMRDACISARAARVIASVSQCVDSMPGYERFECIELTDTAGVLAWPN